MSESDLQILIYFYDVIDNCGSVIHTQSQHNCHCQSQSHHQHAHEELITIIIKTHNEN